MGAENRAKALSGEYEVLSELVKRHYEAWKCTDNAPEVDIIASNPQKEKVAFIQVKSRFASQSLDWEVGRKAFSWQGPKRFYVFVDFRKQTDPVYYVVPSKIVSRVTKEAHWKWCEKKGKDPETYTGRPGFYFAGHREVVKYNVSAPKEEDHRGRWDLLKLD